MKPVKMESLEEEILYLVKNFYYHIIFEIHLIFHNEILLIHSLHHRKPHLFHFESVNMGQIQINFQFLIPWYYLKSFNSCRLIFPYSVRGNSSIN